MSGARVIYFDGRALSVDLASDDFSDTSPALHVASLASSIEQLAAVARDVATGALDPQMPSRMHGLLVAIELMGSLCGVIAHDINDESTAQ